MKAMILAAGLGTRLRPYSRHTPKPLFTIDQRPLLDIIIERLQQSGCEAAMINTHYHHTQIEAFVQAQDYPLPVTTRHEPEILGTGGGIRNMSDFWEDEPMLVLNADIVCDIDLEKIFRFHRQHVAPVTMVMHDCEAFNSVWVDRHNRVVGFQHGSKPAADTRKLAFTGIHVLDRRVLDFLPASGPAHIIDAYQRMLDSGESISAYVSRDHYWQDIGTPQNYRAAVYDHMAPAAFAKAFGTFDRTPIECRRLHGDGSDRQWFRLKAGPQLLIMADHGLRMASDQQEVDAYVDIGRHLWACAGAVPRIWSYDRFAGLVFLEDLGDRNLQQAAAELSNSRLMDLYRRVIDRWVDMAMECVKGFDPEWTYQTRQYNRRVILENECRYFVEAFCNGYLGWEIEYEAMAEEFENLASETLTAEPFGLMHRDLQSRNIMIYNEEIYFIDFQGARPGPLQYDLASLLIDPYVDLPRSVQKDLLAYCADRIAGRYGIDAAAFQRGYPCCALTRNLQMLGAFSYLSRVKNKTQFETYIPRAVQRLQRRLTDADAIAVPLPKLTQAADRAAKQITRCRRIPWTPSKS
ncbi:MAG: sugar phosphate nucleotidyltransferase [Desulfobacteraceae bacterium]|jgi:aminoglycoside/choline kinase family phosphotransferase/dTDP-glucose pyrophosphorylase